MQITKYTVYSDRLSKLKIALISDLHDRAFDEASEVLLAEKPDLIALAGDITNYRMYGNHRAAEVFKACCAAAPSFFCPGNHEWSFAADDRELCEQSGLVYLDNEYVRFGEVLIGGLSTGFHGEKREREGDRHAPEVSWLEDFSRQPDYKILLSHHPDYYERYIRKYDIDLILSGHAHGGQIRIFDRGVYYPDGGFFPKYTKGVFENRLVVSAGLSNTARLIPRLNNPTEIVFIEVGKNI